MHLLSFGISQLVSTAVWVAAEVRPEPTPPLRRRPLSSFYVWLVIAEHGPEHLDPSAGEGEHSMAVSRGCSRRLPLVVRVPLYP